MITHQVRLTEHLRGDFEHVLPVLRLDFDDVIREPLNELRVRVGGTSLARRVDAEVGPLRPCKPERGTKFGTLEIPVSCHAADHPALFPSLRGVIRIRDAGRGDIEIRLVGEYTPPMGVVGTIADRFAGHDAATDSLRGYVREVAARLAAELIQHEPVLDRAPSTVDGGR